MLLKIGGTDFTSYIEAGGFKWQRNDLESPKAGRTLDGTMQRGRVTTKIRLDIKCRPLSNAELTLLLNKIYPEYVTVQYDDPMYGRVTKTMYSNNNPASCLIVHKDSSSTWETWDDVSFPLIER